MKVSDLMTRGVVTVEPEMPLKDVAQLLLERRISGVPVVDREARVLGVVSHGDILYKEHEPELSENEGFLEHLLHPGQGKAEEAKLRARTAEEAMTAPPIMVRPNASIAEAATIMVDRRVNRLPVVEDGRFFGGIEDGELVGIVSRADLVRAFARPDEEIAAEIREIIEGELMLSPTQVTFEIDRGEVVLGGEIEWESSAEMLVAAVSRVPGVVIVDSRLTWREKAPVL